MKDNDFVGVSAGTTGWVIATRLSENPGARVLLDARLGAGGEGLSRVGRRRWPLEHRITWGSQP